VTARKFFVNMGDSSAVELVVEVPVVLEQDVLGAAIEADGWKG